MSKKQEMCYVLASLSQIINPGTEEENKFYIYVGEQTFHIGQKYKDETSFHSLEKAWSLSYLTDKIKRMVGKNFDATLAVNTMAKVIWAAYEKEPIIKVRGSIEESFEDICKQIEERFKNCFSFWQTPIGEDHIYRKLKDDNDKVD